MSTFPGNTLASCYFIASETKGFFGNRVAQSRVISDPTRATLSTIAALHSHLII
mgnify:FL=1